MQLHVPFPYEVHGIAKKRKPNTYVAMSVVSVDIPEMSRADVTGMIFDHRRFVGTEQTIECPMIGSTVYRPGLVGRRAFDGCDILDMDRIDELFGCMRRGFINDKMQSAWALPFGSLDQMSSQSNSDIGIASQVVETAPNSHDLCCERIKRQAQECVMIDGILHSSRHEFSLAKAGNRFCWSSTDLIPGYGDHRRPARNASGAAFAHCEIDTSQQRLSGDLDKVEWRHSGMAPAMLAAIGEFRHGRAFHGPMGWAIQDRLTRFMRWEWPLTAGEVDDLTPVVEEFQGLVDFMAVNSEKATADIFERTGIDDALDVIEVETAARNQQLHNEMAEVADFVSYHGL